jgi:hypothetical protein
MSTELRKKPGSACAEVWLDGVLVGEVEFMNFPPVDHGNGDAWRWRLNSGEWGDAATQEAAVAVVVARAGGTPDTL